MAAVQRAGKRGVTERSAGGQGAESSCGSARFVVDHSRRLMKIINCYQLETYCETLLAQEEEEEVVVVVVTQLREVHGVSARAWHCRALALSTVTAVLPSAALRMENYVIAARVSAIALRKRPSKHYVRRPLARLSLCRPRLCRRHTSAVR